MFGNTASVLIANPNGISCNGCSFSNAWRVSLAAAKPELSAGDLSLTTANGGIVIQGRGLNASNVEYFDIVGGSAVIDGPLSSKDLTISAGNHRFNYNNRIATAISTSNFAPAHVINTTNLGGMQGNRIRLVSTGSGLGINLAGGINAFGDLIIESAGDANLGMIYAGQIYVSSRSGVVATKGPISASGNVTLVGPSILVQRSLQSKGNVDLQSASGDITIDNAGAITSGGRTTAFSGNSLSVNGSFKSRTGDILLYAAKDIDFGVSGSAQTSMNLAATAGRNFTTRSGSYIDGGDVGIEAMKINHASLIHGYNGVVLLAKATGSALSNLSQYTSDNADLYISGQVDSMFGKISLHTFGNLGTALGSRISSRNFAIAGSSMSLGGFMYASDNSSIYASNTIAINDTARIDLYGFTPNSALTIIANKVDLKGMVNARNLNVYASIYFDENKNRIPID